MHCAHVYRVLELVEAEEERERFQHRLDQFVLFRSASMVAFARSEKPRTKEDVDEEKKAKDPKYKPPEPTAEEWAAQKRLEEMWVQARRDDALARQSPWHFEAAMGYAEHVFDEPTEPEQKDAAELRKEFRERDEAARNDLIAALEATVAAQKG